jgi:hypothetical protein
MSGTDIVGGVDMAEGFAEHFVLHSQCGGDEHHGPTMIDSHGLMAAGEDDGHASDPRWEGLEFSMGGEGR